MISTATFSLLFFESGSNLVPTFGHDVLETDLKKRSYFFSLDSYFDNELVASSFTLDCFFRFGCRLLSLRCFCVLGFLRRVASRFFVVLGCCFPVSEGMKVKLAIQKVPGVDIHKR